MITIQLATAERWRDITTVFGVRGDPSSCFCQFFVDADWDRGTDSNRSALHRQVADWEPAPGLLAYLDGEPVGWTQVGPRQRYPRLNKRHEPEPEEWFVTCFVVRVGYRRKGVSTALLSAAVDYAREHGARVLRARPSDTRAGRRPGADLFTGVLSTFLEAGFQEVARNHSRVTVELALS